MIACRIKEGKDGEGKGEKRKETRGKEEKGLFPATTESTFCSQPSSTRAEGVRHLITVAIKQTFTGVLLYARH